MVKRVGAYWTLVLLLLLLTACGKGQPAAKNEGQAPATRAVTVTDQLGRVVTVPPNLQKVAAMDHLPTMIMFALGQQDKLVQRSLVGKLDAAIAAVDEKYAAKASVVHTSMTKNNFSVEELAAKGAQLVIVYASFDRTVIQQLENAGMTVLAVKGETVEESFAAVRLLAKVFDREEQGEKYIAACEKIMNMVKERVGNIPVEQRPKIMFTGAQNILTAATGDMLQNTIIETAGGGNVAKGLTGFWASVSPEQIAEWNPDVILLGSSKDTYGLDEIYNSSHYKTVKAVNERRVYLFPSNIGWWDYPAPHCVLGILWTAKMLYPDKFADIDMNKTADEFYTDFLGHSFSSLGGKL